MRRCVRTSLLSLSIVAVCAVAPAADFALPAPDVTDVKFSGKLKAP